jgi:hypothetical protein
MTKRIALVGQRGNDDFAVGDNIFTPVVVDGGSGTDTLDYGVRTTPVTSAPAPDSGQAAPAGTVLRYRLSEAATVTVDVLPSKGTRFLARLTRRAKAGARSLAFSGRVKGRTLKPGSYRLRVRATDAGGNRSAARTVRFRVVRR